jgi:hypothetical protein
MLVKISKRNLHANMRYCFSLCFIMTRNILFSYVKSKKTDMTVIKNSDMKVMWEDHDVEVLQN